MEYFITSGKVPDLDHFNKKPKVETNSVKVSSFILCRIALHSYILLGVQEHFRLHKFKKC